MMKNRIAWLVMLALTVNAFGAEPAEKEITDAQLDEALTAAAAQTQGEAFTKPLQSVAPRFREVPVSAEAGAARWHKVTLNGRGKKLDAVRFRVPAGEARGMVWAFVPPANLGGWYILPTAGEMQGFKKFFRPSAQKVLGKKAPEGSRQVLLQTLDAANLKPGGEYIVWFRFKDEKPAPVYLAIALPAGGEDVEEYDEGAVIKTLGLTAEGTELGEVDLDEAPRAK